ncbi:hypothetical protein ACEZDB_12940 [Streptacidiphilus sp. N1-3]|uniref:Uncharacterized protein n=1 Tax=Streptacidiphilus alkalitolerans TaxID=3342712 RepID=A0ABV6WZS8_9ACTN
MVHLAAYVGAVGTSGWDSFYSGRLRLCVQFLVPFAIALAVLVGVSGMVTRWIVFRDAEAWGRGARGAWAVPGCLALLAAAVFVPLFPLFAPFTAGSWLRWAYGFGLIVPALALLLVGARPDFHSRHWPGLTGRRQLQLPAMFVLLCLWSALGSGFYFWGRREQLLLAELSLALFGVTATALALGQSLRLQVETLGADGSPDASATDYVLARIQQSDSHKANGLGISRSADLSALITADFSAVPVGALASWAARVMFGFRPGLTWRARVTVVDENRVVVALTRNSLNVENTIISRGHLGLPELPAHLKAPQLEAELGRAHAQLLTGAAACILVCLSRVHTELRHGLCGAEQWQGVAMQMIADEPALVQDAGLRLGMLRRAVELEPRYGTARLAYLYALHDQFRGPFQERLRFARWMDSLVALAQEEDGSTRKGWEVIRMRAGYSSVAMRWNHCLEELAATWNTSRTLSRVGSEALDAAGARATELTAYCEGVRPHQDGRYAAWYAGRMVPLAANLTASIDFLEAARRGEGPAEWPRGALAVDHPWPRLAYVYGCSAALVRDFDGTGREPADLLDCFTFATATDADRRELLNDPAYALLRRAGKSDELDALLSPVTSGVQLLELPPFAACAPQLTRIGVTTVDALRRRVATAQQRAALAQYLDLDPVVVTHFAELAELAGLHRDFDDPTVLKLLLGLGVDSRRALLEQVDPDEAAFLARLRTLAARDGLGGLPAVAHPGDWLAAVRGLTAPAIP